MPAATEFLIGCTIDGVRYYYNHGVLGPRLAAVRFGEHQRGNADEILSWLREKGYRPRLIRVTVWTPDGQVPTESIPIGKKAPPTPPV